MTGVTLGAALMAFLVSVLFGKRWVAWLEKKNARQPLKDEVARIYAADKADDTEEK